MVESACVVCETRTPRTIGVLCATCAAKLVIGERRAPGIFTSARAAKPEAWLIDCWGQLHGIVSPCRIGRAQDNTVRIADLSVSAEHAELTEAGGTWTLRDLGSSNGSGIGGRAIRDATVKHHDRLWFGSLAFVWWGDPEPPARDVPPPDVRTLVPAAAAFRIHGPAEAWIEIRAVRGHQLAVAPGELRYHEHPQATPRRVALPRLQYQLLRTLCEAAVSAGDASDGFVRSNDLVASLPFQTSTPSPNHLRQVVATLRSTLARVGITEEKLVEGREGSGYRVCWDVTPIAEDAR